jgi:hypothetical protein
MTIVQVDNICAPFDASIPKSIHSLAFTIKYMIQYQKFLIISDGDWTTFANIKAPNISTTSKAWPHASSINILYTSMKYKVQSSLTIIDEVESHYID